MSLNTRYHATVLDVAAVCILLLNKQILFNERFLNLQLEVQHQVSSSNAFIAVPRSNKSNGGKLRGCKVKIKRKKI
jgi:hypothetical protein